MLSYGAKSNQGGIETELLEQQAQQARARQNRTKVGLKRGAVEISSKNSIRQNRTKVGLKRVAARLGVWRWVRGKIEPRWD